MTFPTDIHRYVQLIQNLRSQTGYSYGDLVVNLKIYVPQIRWKKKSNQGAWTGSKTDLLVLRIENDNKGGKRDRRTEGPIDTSKTCRYCIDVKGWRGIRHTERDCRTKKRECSNPATTSLCGVKKIVSKPYNKESDYDFELDQEARIAEVYQVHQHSQDTDNYCQRCDFWMIHVSTPPVLLFRLCRASSRVRFFRRF